MKKLLLLFLILGLAGCNTPFGAIPPLTKIEKTQLDFTQNLENIDHQSIGIKNNKGIWIPTERELEEVYKYIYGEDMVNWQLPDGTSMCGVGREATNCVPHWRQEFENAKFNGNLIEAVRKNEVNADAYNISPQLITKKKSWNKKIIIFLKSLIQPAYAGVEFFDTYTVDINEELSTHIPDIGTGYTRIKAVLVGNETLLALNSIDVLFPGVGGAADGALYETDDTMSGADYTIEVLQANGDTDDDTLIIACRVTDVTHMYALRWNETVSDLYVINGAGWSTIDTGGGGIADGSIVELICEGTSISVEDDDVEILSAIDATHSSAGKTGVGMGSVIVVGDDLSGQRFDNLTITVSAAPPAAVDEPRKDNVMFF